MKPFEKLTYEQKIRWRLRLSWALLAAMLVYMVAVTELGGGDSREMSRLAGTVSRLIFFGGMVVVGTRIAHNRKLLRDIVLRRQQMLRERDERNRWLHDKSGGIVLDALLACLLFITVTCALFDNAAFYASFSVLLLALLFKGAAYLAYSRM